jgi:thiamine biosynthesis lipoprotein
VTEGALAILDAMGLSRRRFLMALAGAVSGGIVGIVTPTTARRGPRGRAVVLGRAVMGTVVEARADHSDVTLAREAAEVALERMAEVDRLMSTFRSDSELSRTNRLAAAQAVRVGEQTFSVLVEASRVSEASRGAFDVTVHPLMRLWRSATRSGRLPSSRELDAVLRSVAHADLWLDAGQRRVRFGRPGMGIDLGGIAKGYAVDRAAAALAERGATSGLIDAGGDLRVIGRTREGTSWRIGLRHPLDPSRILLSILAEDEAVATSGNYFASFNIDGRGYGHLLDPRTGVPARAPLSATVIAGSAMRADGLASAAMILGQDALDFIRGLGADGIVIEPRDGSDGHVVARLTPGLKGRIDLLDRRAVLET